MAGAPPLFGQVPAEPVLRGRALVGDSALTRGDVILHHVGADIQGELDTARVASDGTFSFRLPTVPDEEASEIYFASIRHHGVLYFGQAVGRAVQLDSVYEIQTYDTVSVEPRGRALPIQVRNVFLEPEDDRWRVTDLLQVRNEASRTLVARDDGVVWRHALPDGAEDFSLGQGELTSGSAGFERGALVVQGAIPPGERLFVARYTVPDPYLSLPLDGVTEVLELMVREPAPALDVPGLTRAEGVELEPGTTYRRYTGTGLQPQILRLEEGSEPARFPVEWMAVLLALLLAGAGLYAFRGSLAPAPAGAAEQAAAPAAVGGAVPADDARQDLILQVALLDEELSALAEPTPQERADYEARREELLARIESGS